MLRDDEVYLIYRHIASMCGHPDPAEACRIIIKFCRHEMGKLERTVPFLEPPTKETYSDKD
jgi:hypothetical protein